MGFPLFSLCFFLCLVGTYAFNWDSYWHSVLPNTQFPNSLRNAIQPENRNAPVTRYLPAGDPVSIQINYAPHRQQSPKTQSREGKNAPVTRYLPAGGPVDIRINYAPNQQGNSKITYEHDVTTFFLETNLHVGQRMKLHFPESKNDAKFLSREAAESIPFSSNKLPEILKHFGIKPNSVQADRVRSAIEQCEAPAIKGEDKFCATSLESLIDFGVSRLGRGVQVYSTEVNGGKGEKQVYSISKKVKKVGVRSVVCHKQNYLYAVFYCHEIRATTAYKVSLAGADGTNVEAVALCHTDTSSWSPQHVAFQMLKVKPGGLPICHFTSRDNLVWVP